MARSRLIDVARATGFSVNTVSLALRGSPRVAPATRASIEAVSERLGYVPNRVARSLVEQRTRTIGVVLTDIMNPSLTAVAQHIERDLADRGYSMLLVTTEQSVEREQRALQVLRAQQVDGILLFPVSHRELGHLAAAHDESRPLVLLAGDQDAAADLVAVDNEAGAVAAVRHLLALGHRRIGLLNGGVRIGNSEKLRGYRSALLAAGIAPDPALEVAPDGFSHADGFAAAAQLFASVPDTTALFASTDQLAIGALAWCNRNGRRVPSDVSVVGFDDTEAARFCHPPLTSIVYDADRVAHESVRRLMDRIQGVGADQAPTHERTVIPARISIRESSGPAPGSTSPPGGQS
jgi:LacI family transcriptional regulator